MGGPYGLVNYHWVEQHMSSYEVLWQDDSELVIRITGTEAGATEIRRYSYARSGDSLLLTDGYGVWSIGVPTSGRRTVGDAQTGGLHPGEVITDGRVTSQMPGKVLEVRVALGATVARGEVLLVLEAMKMEHSIAAPCAGTVTTLTLAPGDRVMPGDLLAEIEPSP
jgi:acetyl/propionyl-CoA carboxylase alpha subunit